MPSMQELQADREALEAAMRDLEDVIARQAALDAEYEAKRANLAGVRNQSVPVADSVSSAPAAPAVSIDQMSHSEPAERPKRGPNGSSPDEIVAAAIKAVNEAGKPLTRYELVQAVEARGSVVGGNDKARNMGTILWRSKAFDNDGEGYRPKSWKAHDPYADPLETGEQLDYGRF